MLVIKVENNAFGAILSLGRFFVTSYLYIGFTYVFYSFFPIQHPQGEQYMPGRSVGMQVVIHWLRVTVADQQGWRT